MQEKFVCLSMSIAAELWLRDAIDTEEEVFTHAARNFTLRLAEKLAQRALEEWERTLCENKAVAILAQMQAQYFCFAGTSLVLLCFIVLPSNVSWQQRLIALCGGFHPLHHVAGDVEELSLATLRYSSG